MLKALIAILFIPSFTFASLQIPRGLSSSDRRIALDILGSGTAVKTLGDPYPLGGYSGFEIGLSLEQLQTGDIAKLGNTAVGQESLRYWMFTVGKGLFYNVDFFLQFAPIGQNEQFSAFGGALRWGFHELQNYPVNFSLQIAGNSSSFQNLINTSTQTLSLVVGYNLVDWSIYGSAGFVRASGLFIGGSDGITDTNETHTESTTANHYSVGVSYRFRKLFAAAEFDYTGTNVFSAKIGLRY